MSAGVVDLLARIDALDDLIHDARPVPLTSQVRIEKDEAYRLLDEIRALLPEVLKAAGGTDTPRAEAPGEPSPPATPVEVQEAARTLTSLLERVKFGGEAFRLESHGMAMAELRPPSE